jgi:hypothetical protein
MQETPQFRNIFVKNVVCNGAEKAIFVRGLPEMNVKNIVLQDMVLQAEEGLDMTEASNFSLRNIRLITKNTDPVLNIHNSNNIVVDNIDYKAGANLLLNVSGEKSKGIIVSKTDTGKAAKKLTATYGASEAAVEMR